MLQKMKGAFSDRFARDQTTKLALRAKDAALDNLLVANVRGIDARTQITKQDFF